MSEPAAGQAERCEVRVHEQIRRSTGPAERVHPGSPETKPTEGRHANISVGRAYPTRPADPLERDKGPSRAGQPASTPRSCRRPAVRECAGPVASSAVDLVAQTRRGRRVALGAGIRDRPANALCRTGHRRRRPRRCSCCVGRCALGWDHGVPTDLARALLSIHIVLSLPVSALGGQLLVGQAAPSNSPAASLYRFIFGPCRVVTR